MDKNFDFLARMAHAIAKQFGNDCEVVVHNLTVNPYESSIVIIENGHISGRKVGDGPSSVLLEALAKDPAKVEDHLCYLTEIDGKILKSSTVFIRDDDGKIIGIFGINYDISRMIMLKNELQELISVESSDNKEYTHIPQDVNSLLDDLIERAVKMVGRPVAYMSREDKIEAIKFLDSAGAFLITKSGDRISNYFGISKFTMYSYLDKIKESEQ